MKECPDWGKIKTVFLDLDGTLLDLHFDNHFWLEYVPLRYADKHDISFNRAKRELMDHYTRVRGSLDWYCVDFWSRELELDIEQLKHDISDKIAVHPQVEDFLLSIRAIGKRIILVTNAHPASLSLKMNKTGLRVYFDRIINAHVIGLAKEHDGFWQKLHAIEPFSTDNTLLIDDNIEVLEGAEHYGIAHLLAIHRPDSRGDVAARGRYAQLKSFSEIMPS